MDGHSQRKSSIFHDDFIDFPTLRVSAAESQPTTPWLTKPQQPAQDTRSPNSLPPPTHRADALRRSRPDVPVQERTYPPKPLHWDDLSKVERTDWYAEHGTTADQPTTHKFTYTEATPVFWDDLTDNGQARWKHRHRETAPTPDQSPTAVSTARCPDHTSIRTSTDSTNSTTHDHLPPIQQTQPASTAPTPHRLTPGPSHETPTQPTILLTELPPIHDRATPRPRRSPGPADQPGPTPRLPPIGRGFESHQAEAEETIAPAAIPDEAQPSLPPLPTLASIHGRESPHQRSPPQL